MLDLNTDFYKSLISLLSNNVINLPKEEIYKLYNLWNTNFDNSKSDDTNCVYPKHLIQKEQNITDKSVLLGIDLPTWFGQKSSKGKKIIIVGIDPLRNNSTFKKANANLETDVIIGTPYAFHHEKMRLGKTRAYWEFVNGLSQDNFVYVTDIYKTFFYTDISKKQRSYSYYATDAYLREQVQKVLHEEIKLINPDLIITLGAQSFTHLTNSNCPKLTNNIKNNKYHLNNHAKTPVIPMMHLSGSTREKSLQNFVDANDIVISETGGRWKYGLAFKEMIEKQLQSW